MARHDTESARSTQTVYSYSMQVRMKRRFRRGVELPRKEFGAQAWSGGQLELRGNVLYLCTAGAHGKPLPNGTLYRPTLKACFSETISFAGIERDGEAWNAQVWFCEVRRSELAPQQ